MKNGALRSLSSLFARPRMQPPKDPITRPRSQPSNRPSKDQIAPRRPSPSSDRLFREIEKIGDPKVSIAPVLDRWVEEGRPVFDSNLQIFVRKLKSRRRFSHALELLTWMTDKNSAKLSTFEDALRLGLIGKVHGIEQAENFFNNIPEHQRSFHVYRALLNCYANAKSVEKAEATMQKMRDLGIADKRLPYNHLLNLYRQSGSYEKMDDVMREMEEKGVDYDYISYNLRLNAYADVSDVDGIDKILTRVESHPKITMNWVIYSSLANAYARVGLVDKVLLMLKKIEEMIPTNNGGNAFRCLLTQHAGIGKKDEVKRIWEAYKKKEKLYNSSYFVMIDSILKFDDIKSAEEIFKEWESTDLTLDIQIPNLLINHYCQKGLLEKAEALISKLALDGKKFDQKTWFCLATGYIEDNQTQKAVVALKEGLSIDIDRIKPSPETVVACLEFLKAEGDTEKTEELVRLLRAKSLCSDDTIDKLTS